MTEKLEATSAPKSGLPIVYRPSALYTTERETDRQLDQLRPAKASESIAARIVADIVDRGLAVGDRLPPESEMLLAYGVSRESLREALRILEVQGLIAIKRGPGGGPFVTALNASYLARTETLYFNLAGATYDEVFETWEILEPPLSAKVASIPDREVKRSAFAQFLEYDAPAHAHDEVFASLNNFHAVIAELSGNRVLTLVTQAINHIVVDHVLSAEDPVTENVGLAASHDDIAHAIIAGRSTRAATLMRQHIHEVTENFRNRHPERMEGLVEWR